MADKSKDQETLRREGEKIILDMIRKKMETSSLMIALSEVWSWGLTFNKVPGLEELFDDHKDGYMKLMLKAMKMGSLDDLRFVQATVERLEAIGIRWPELDVINRSIDADMAVQKEVAEAEEQLTPDEQRQRRNMISRLRRGDYIYAMNRAFSVGFNTDDPWFAALMEEIKPVLIKRIKYYLSEINTARKADILVTELERLGVKWPELYTVARIKRKALIVQMLKVLKSGNFWNTSIPGALRILRRLGAQWPELDIIERSVAADKKLKDVGQLDESWAGIYANELYYLLKQVGVSHPGSGLAMERHLDTKRNEILEMLARHANEHWDDIFNMVRTLRKMAALAFHSRDWPQLTEIVNRHKSKVVRMLLEMIKAGEWRVEDVQDQLEHLRQLRVDWPELDIIERSIKAEINEGSSLYDWPASAVMNRIHQDQMTALYSGVQDLRYKGVKDSIIISALEPHDSAIAQWANKQLSQYPSNEKLIFSVIRLLEMGGNFPNLVKSLGQHKLSFIKYLLILYKKTVNELNEPYISTDLNKLGSRIQKIQAAGINWPELDSILLSIQGYNNNEKINVMEDDYMTDLIRSAYDNSHAWVLVNRMRGLAIPNDLHQQAVNVIEKRKSEFIRDLLRWVKVDLGTYQNQVRDSIEDLRKLGINWSELDIIERSIDAQKQDIVQKHFPNQISESKISPAALRAYFILEEMLEQHENAEGASYYLAVYGKDPEKASFSVFNINGYKTELLKDMLYSIKNYDTDDEVNMTKEDLLHMIAGARKLGAKWPELDVMERSLKIGLAEGAMDDTSIRIATRHFHKVLRDLEEEDYSEIANHLAWAGAFGVEDAIRFPDYSVRIDRHKPEILKAVLIAIKDPDQFEFDNNDLIMMARALRRMHIKWPELDIIERSLKQDVK
jgi:hypothetical protein